MKPDWIPDWLNGANYPSAGSARQWAWEFLRRNPEYQRLWDELIRPTYNPAALNDWDRPRTRGPGRKTRVRLDDTPTVADQFRERFHIHSYPPAPSEADAKLRFDTEFIQYELGVGVSHDVHGVIREGQAVLWFNLDWPIAPQLANAEALLRKLQGERKNFRTREDLYSKYLRVLDARAAGASLAEIARTLYPRSSEKTRIQNVRDHRKAAQRLRDQDFWLIALPTRNSDRP